jgi:hypothetical protein
MFDIGTFHIGKCAKVYVEVAARYKFLDMVRFALYALLADLSCVESHGSRTFL